MLNERLSLESGKCKMLDKLISTITQRGEKVLIFSQFTMMLDILEVYLKCSGHSEFLRFDGSTNVMQRQALIDRFNMDDSIQIFLISTKSGGLGVNLTAANHVIIHDIDFNPHNDRQAEDRCHRMGQQKEVHVTRLISKGTIEENIFLLAQKKLELENDVNSEDYSEGKLDTNMVKKLLNTALSIN